MTALEPVSDRTVRRAGRGRSSTRRAVVVVVLGLNLNRVSIAAWVGRRGSRTPAPPPLPPRPRPDPHLRPRRSHLRRGGSSDCGSSTASSSSAIEPDATTASRPHPNLSPQPPEQTVPAHPSRAPHRKTLRQATSTELSG